MLAYPVMKLHFVVLQEELIEKQNAVTRGSDLDSVRGLKNHVTVKPLLMNVLFLTTLPNLKACNSACIEYYFKRFFVLHSSEALFSFLIKKSRQKEQK